MKRTIVHIDEELCDGCALCIPNCQEGALQIVDGKAKLVSDVLCDGFGACLGHCPQDAIIMIEREADEFDEEAVEEHLVTQAQATVTAGSDSPGPASPSEPQSHSHQPSHGHSCPGSAMRDMRTPQRPAAAPSAAKPDLHIATSLQNWPVQLHLLNPNAPYLQHADLLLAADCVPFAMPDFHAKLLQGRTVAIGCPKLDDVSPYIDKLAHIFAAAELTALTVAIMEVPCCGGLVQVVANALQKANVEMPVRVITIGVQGEVKDSQLFMVSK